jgi:hypothetical protein
MKYVLFMIYTATSGIPNHNTAHLYPTKGACEHAGKSTEGWSEGWVCITEKESRRTDGRIGLSCDLDKERSSSVYFIYKDCKYYLSYDGKPSEWSAWYIEQQVIGNRDCSDQFYFLANQQNSLCKPASAAATERKP